MTCIMQQKGKFLKDSVMILAAKFEASTWGKKSSTDHPTGGGFRMGIGSSGVKFQADPWNAFCVLFF